MIYNFILNNEYMDDNYVKILFIAQRERLSVNDTIHCTRMYSCEEDTNIVNEFCPTQATPIGMFIYDICSCLNPASECCLSVITPSAWCLSIQSVSIGMVLNFCSQIDERVPVVNTWKVWWKIRNGKDSSLYRAWVMKQWFPKSSAADRSGLKKEVWIDG